MPSKRRVTAPGEINPTPKDIRRMWDGGPLRQFSQTQVSSHYSGYYGAILRGYAGSYICDQCKRPSGGVYFCYLSESRKEWLCGRCKNQRAGCGGVR